jgi:hypothetical protein
VSYPVVCELLHDLDYSLQAYRTVRERGDYTGRDYMFALLNAQAIRFISQEEPVISIDIMKKDSLSDNINSEELWQVPGHTMEEYINDHPGANRALVIPYTIFEPTQNASWKKIRIDKNIVTFVVESIYHWWEEEGKSKFPSATWLLIGTPGVGLHQPHAPLWKRELQWLADETQLMIKYCDLPEGTSKWCKFENRLFAWIKQIKRGSSITNYAFILRNITVATPNTERIVQCYLNTNTPHADRKIPIEEESSICLVRGSFPEDWNYDIFPHDVADGHVYFLEKSRKT